MADTPFFVLRQLTADTSNTCSQEDISQIDCKQLTTRGL